MDCPIRIRPVWRASSRHGPLARTFNHLFSTKSHDWETGLFYYGYRYYNPHTGRWPSRDPIGENGGLNLYGFAGDNPITRIDPLGFNYYGGGNADFKEKFACWWDCGAEKSKKAAALAGQALAATEKRFPGMSLHNDKADAWRHCFWSCEMARAIGQECAKSIGDNHENAGDRKGQPKN
jgi:RHS repeat-associated protein